MNTRVLPCAAAVTLCLLAVPARMAAAEPVKAFPTAEGFGAKAVGGRGGRIIEVTNLDDSGDGSLRSAMEASGPRIVVFRVSGTITLKSAIRVSTPCLTVAGQTSPGGVQVRGTGRPDGDWGVWCVNGAHDIILRHLRVRMGGKLKHDAGNWGPRSPTGCANDWVGHGVNTWDYYEFKKDGSTHLVDPAQYGAAKPFPAPPVTLDPMPLLLDKVLAAAGACKPSRDAVDRRIVQSVRDGAGTSRASTTGPWPDLAAGAPAPAADSDHDGMPDAWEEAHGLDPNHARDGAALAANGYTHVENYLNELAGDPVPEPGQAPVTSPDRP